MRSQLDCVDPRLPGSGVFDIKTRAAMPLRLDNLNFKVSARVFLPPQLNLKLSLQENSGYLITSLHGAFNSFDREYYDLIRSAFLKYRYLISSATGPLSFLIINDSFQVRIGGMDGIFLAYHNTARLFGFQYVPLEEMDRRVFGVGKKKGATGLNLGQYETGGTAIGWRIFHKCVRMLEALSEEIVACFPGKVGSVALESTFSLLRGFSLVYCLPGGNAWNGNHEGVGSTRR